MEKVKKRNPDGTLKKGVVLNKTGRPKGSINKSTAEMRKLIGEYVSNEMSNVEDLLQELTAKERLDVLCKMLPYILPRKIHVTEDEEKVFVISFDEPIKGREAI